MAPISKRKDWKPRARTLVLIAAFTLSSCFLLSTVLYGDVIVLKNNSLITCKIIRELDKAYLFSNYDGTFKIKDEYIKRIYVTDSYKEDIEIYRKYGKTVIPEAIRRDHEAGLRMKAESSNRAVKTDHDKREKGKSAVRKRKWRGGSGYEEQHGRKRKRYFWDYGRLSFSGNFFGTVSLETGSSLRINEVLPLGVGTQLSYDQGMEIGARRRNPWRPGLRFEFIYMHMSKRLFTDTTLEMGMYGGAGGLMWALPYLEHNKGCAVLAILPGACYMNITNRDSGEQSGQVSMLLIGLLGYEYSFHRSLSFFIHFQYIYIHDARVAFHGVGGSFGLSFRLW